VTGQLAVRDAFSSQTANREIKVLNQVIGDDNHLLVARLCQARGVAHEALFQREYFWSTIMERTSGSQIFPLGSKLPTFQLMNVDGSTIGSDYFQGGKAYLVAFLCNHCPYVKGSEEMLIAIVNKFAADGLKTVTINSNDALKYPDDSFDKMQEKSREMSLPYPYLYDESQAVARKFDAACTPEFFLFDSGHTLVYHGTINDSPRDPTKVTKDYLSQAIMAVIEGQLPNPQFVHPLGCSIKWR
jgi:thiol-disulfide isomerase/thioredoxin